MQNILLDKKLTVTEEAQDYLVTISNHSIREMVNYLEKIYIVDGVSKKGEQTVFDLATCQVLCSNISFQQFELYLDHLKSGNVTKAIAIFYHIYDYGYSIIDIFDYFYSFIKYTASITEDQKYRVLPFLCKYITVFHNIHEDCIELALFTNNIATIFIQS